MGLTAETCTSQRLAFRRPHLTCSLTLYFRPGPLVSPCLHALSMIMDCFGVSPGHPRSKPLRGHVSIFRCSSPVLWGLSSVGGLFWGFHRCSSQQKD